MKLYETVLLIKVEIIMFLEKDDEARERDQMRYERHKDRARERNLARAAPDKRYMPQNFIKVNNILFSN